MKSEMVLLNRMLFVVSLFMIFLSIYMKDVDKAPIYVLLAYIFLRLD
jgi:hypothetical protein